MCPQGIGFGQTVGCAIDSPGEMDTYAFTADPGDEVILRMTTDSGDLRPGIRVYDSDGTQLCQASGLSSAEIDGCTLKTGGTYSALSPSTPRPAARAITIYTCRD